MRTVNEIVEKLKQGEIKRVRIGWSGLLCVQPCGGYHASTYVVYENKKFYKIVVGNHHAGSWSSQITEMKELSEEEARKLIEVAINGRAFRVYE